jgi:hypothetical protein
VSSKEELNVNGPQTHSLYLSNIGTIGVNMTYSLMVTISSTWFANSVGQTFGGMTTTRLTFPTSLLREVARKAIVEAHENMGDHIIFVEFES